ncbi:MAG TPA: MFS transporter [Candidatus Angelobacter sp.]|nr:MFS transporter [Candidatus Angelobacter sp.]
MEPDVVVAQVGVSVSGHPADLGWDGLGRRFGRYWIAATLSFYGDWFTTVALVLLLFRLSGPAAPAGYMLARVLPRIFSSGIGGALADRFPPQQVVALCATIQGLFTVTIIPSARIGAAWAVFGAVVITQFAGGIARPALGALVPRIAPARRLQRANALYSLGFSSSIAVGPALAAVLLTVTGPETLLAIDAVTFVIAAGLMISLRLTRSGPGWAPTARGVSAGIRAVWNDPLLRSIAAGWMCSAVAVTAASSVLVLIARSTGEASRVGYLYGAVGAGSVLSGLLVLRYRPRVVTREMIAALTIIEVIFLAVITLQAPFWAVLLALALSGGTSVMWQTWGTTDMQMRTDAAVIGRVNAAVVLSASAGMFVGALLALLLVPIAGWERTLFIACCVGLVLLALGIGLGPQARDTPS